MYLQYTFSYFYTAEDFDLLMLMFPVALIRGLAECRVVPDRMGPMVVYPQPQSGVCQASLANSSPENCSFAKLGLALLMKLHK